MEFLEGGLLKKIDVKHFKSGALRIIKIYPGQ